MVDRFTKFEKDLRNNSDGMFQPGSLFHREAFIWHHFPDATTRIEWSTQLDLGSFATHVNALLGDDELDDATALIDETTLSDRSQCLIPMSGREALKRVATYDPAVRVIGFHLDMYGTQLSRAIPSIRLGPVMRFDHTGVSIAERIFAATATPKLSAKSAEIASVLTEVTYNPYLLGASPKA